MWESALEQLSELKGARLQKVALRLDADERPGCSLDLYQQQKFMVAFFGATLRVAQGKFDDPDWQAAKPSKNQQAFRHHLTKTQLQQVRQHQGILETIWGHTDGVNRYLMFEPGKHHLCVLLAKASEQGPRIIAFHGHSEDKNSRRRVGRLYEWPSQGLKPLAPSAAGKPAMPPVDPRLQQIRKEQKRLKRLLKNLQRDLARLGDAQTHYEHGKALTVHLQAVQKGQTSLSCETANGVAVTIPLRPDRTPADNLELIFKKAKKAKRGHEKLKPRLQAVQQQLSLLSHCLDAPETVSEGQWQVLLRPEKLAPSARRKSAMASTGKSWRCFQVNEDAFVWVGKHAKGNDALTFHHAKGNDFWFHIRDASGAHVIVPFRFSQQAEVLEAAGQLAAHFSPLRGEAKVQIRMTQRKNLRKPGKGAPAGKVLVSAEENRVVHTAPTLIEALLAQEKPA